MFKSCVIGASGYTGVELCNLLLTHPHFELSGLFVSENSDVAHRKISDIHPKLLGKTEQTLTPISNQLLSELAAEKDAIFLATPHQASHDWMDLLLGKKASIFDLSGAFRLSDTKVFASAYGFEHEKTDALHQAVYGLVDYNSHAIKNTDLVAVPGCYPTASLTALKPLQQHGLLAQGHLPIINAVSGVSGAGRKGSLSSSFCEVSLKPYGVHTHRHQPEIAEHLGTEVIFTPHLGNFKRGILATITAKLTDSATTEKVDAAFQAAYQDKPLVRFQPSWPVLDDVVGTPYCDLHWQYNPNNQHIVIASTIDNVLKGAASQALQCANVKFGLSSHEGLM